LPKKLGNFNAETKQKRKEEVEKQRSIEANGKKGKDTLWKLQFKNK
jgi:hypothetical protein